MHFRPPRSLDKLIHFADRRRPGQGFQVTQQILFLQIEQCLALLDGIRLIPKRRNIHTHHFRRLHHFAQRPQQCAIHAHQLLLRHCIRFIQNTADLVKVSTQRQDSISELVADIEFVRVKQQEHAVGTRGPIRNNRGKIVTASNTLLFAAQNAGRVDERNVLQQRRIHLRHFESVQKAHAKRLQCFEWQTPLHARRIAWNDALLLVIVHDRHKLVRRRLWPNTRAREIAF
mmetsp:Transcript_27628/g.45532  ORF Transcript_27628/g.45532 Transcript_27628/m.45532 type:complete len:230 (+) Transcript_27628:915-1604(+)